MHFLHMSDAAGNVMIAARLGSFCASGPGNEGAAPSWRPGLSVAENDYQIGCLGSLREEDAKKILSNLGIAENPRSLRLTGLGLGAWKMGSASGNNVARFRSASTDILSSHEDERSTDVTWKGTKRLPRRIQRQFTPMRTRVAICHMKSKSNSKKKADHDAPPRKLDFWQSFGPSLCSCSVEQRLGAWAG